jgi:predicted transcriptional regulator
MSEERIGDKFLRKLYEKTVNNGIESIERDEIGKEVGIIDVQMDNLVDELTSDGYIKKIGRTKIYLIDDGRKRTEI